LTHQFPALANETHNTKHILEIKPTNRCFFCLNETQIKLKDLMKLEVANRKRKSIQMHKTNIQCQ